MGGTSGTPSGRKGDGGSSCTDVLYCNYLTVSCTTLHNDRCNSTPSSDFIDQFCGTNCTACCHACTCCATSTTIEVRQVCRRDGLSCRHHTDGSKCSVRTIRCDVSTVSGNASHHLQAFRFYKCILSHDVLLVCHRVPESSDTFPHKQGRFLA